MAVPCLSPKINVLLKAPHGHARSVQRTWARWAGGRCCRCCSGVDGKGRSRAQSSSRASPGPMPAGIAFPPSEHNHGCVNSCSFCIQVPGKAGMFSPHTRAIEACTQTNYETAKHQLCNFSLLNFFGHPSRQTHTCLAHTSFECLRSCWTP